MNTLQIKVIEENAIAYYQGLAHLLGGKFVEQDHLTWFTTGRRGLIRFNGVLHTALPPQDELGPVVDPVLDFFLSQSLPFFWVDWPPVGTPGLGKYLGAKEIPFTTFTMPAMARGLTDLPSSHVPKDTAINPVCNSQDQTDWLDVFMEGFAEPETVRPDFEQFIAGSLSEPQPVFHHFLARWQGKPCAIATLLRAEQCAGIYHVATLPSYRGNGLGRAITLATMQAALVSGYSTAVLFATPSGYPLYQHLGFETVSSADLYAWSGMEQKIE